MAVSMISFIWLLVVFIIVSDKLIEKNGLGDNERIKDYEKNIMLWGFKYMGALSNARWNNLQIWG